MCSLTTTQTNLCTSGIGTVESQIQLLKIIAQLSAELLVTASPSSAITPAAILSRACTSGIGNVQDEMMLLKIIAQTTCELVP